MNYNKENFQRGVRVQMAIHQIKPDQFVKDTELHRNTISNILNSKRADMNIRLSVLDKLCQEFDCTPNDLFRENPMEVKK